MDGEPVATGVVAVADPGRAQSRLLSWRSIGVLHAPTLLHRLRAVGLDDPAASAEAFYAATADIVEPCTA